MSWRTRARSGGSVPFLAVLERPPDRSQQQRRGKVAGGVDPQGRRRPDGGDQDAGDGRAGDGQGGRGRPAGAVGGREPLAAYEGGEGAEAGRVGPDEHHRYPQGGQVHVRQLEDAEGGGQGHGADQGGAEQVAADHEPPPVDPVSERAGEQPEQQVGDGFQSGQESGLGGRPGEGEHPDGEHDQADRRARLGDDLRGQEAPERGVPPDGGDRILGACLGRWVGEALGGGRASGPERGTVSRLVGDGVARGRPGVAGCQPEISTGWAA
jgi:hypothetical protein